MMTNIERAIQVLEKARRHGEIRIHPHDAVEAIVQANLLAEDLPERPDDGIWGEEGEILIDTAVNGGVAITPPHPGVIFLNTQDARKLAYAILAAEQYAEEA